MGSEFASVDLIDCEHMSAFGTKRTSEADGSMSAFGGKADITVSAGLVRF
jgi:hypothetical protein